MGSGRFIPHYTNDRNDFIMQTILMDHGPWGYGMFKLLAEIQCESADGKIPWNGPKSIKFLARQTFTQENVLEKFVTWGIDNLVFEEDDDGIWSPYVKDLIEKSIPQQVAPQKRKREGSVAAELDKIRSRGDISYSSEFEEFWKRYPRRDGKANSYTNFLMNLKAGATAQSMIDAAENYARSRKEKDPQYTLMPQTFLGPSRRWEDYVRSPSSDDVPQEDKESCPVCGTEAIGSMRTCRRCGFYLPDSNDEAAVKDHRDAIEGGEIKSFAEALAAAVKPWDQGSGAVLQ